MFQGLKAPSGRLSRPELMLIENDNSGHTWRPIQVWPEVHPSARHVNPVRHTPVLQAS